MYLITSQKCVYFMSVEGQCCLCFASASVSVLCPALQPCECVWNRRVPVDAFDGQRCMRGVRRRGCDGSRRSPGSALGRVFIEMDLARVSGPTLMSSC